MNASSMTLDEYAKALAKWQETYELWCRSWMIQPVSNPLVAPSEPDSEIFYVRLKLASIWRRFLAELIDFVLLHGLKFFIIFLLSNYFHLFDERRLTLNYLISTILYEEKFFIPIELILVELTYSIGCISFETFCLTRYGGTPGKYLFRLRVLKCDHLQLQDDGDLMIEPATILTSEAALTRSSYKSFMSTFLFPALVITLLTSQYRQTNYDLASNSLVVQIEPEDPNE